MFNINNIKGFNSEIRKCASSTETGIEGLAIGAILGALASGIGLKIIERMAAKAASAGAIAGGLIGGTALGTTGYLYGNDNIKFPLSEEEKMEYINPSMEGKL